jgi:hypothetical protein|uniref:Uncharacterized protein n=1 Tax=Zea mays TaxID=4577 RepID=A0A804PY41_MAIZE
MLHDKGFSEGRVSDLLIENNQWILLSLLDPTIFRASYSLLENILDEICCYCFFFPLVEYCKILSIVFFGSVDVKTSLHRNAYLCVDSKNQITVISSNDKHPFHGSIFTQKTTYFLHFVMVLLFTLART